MGRGKLPMEYITTEKARKSSFKKRKEGLVKKIRELSILCGIDACLIIYGPRNNDGSPMEVHQWPKESKEVERISRKYEMKRNESKHLNLLDFFGNQTCKINEQIAKMRREIANAKFAKSREIWFEGVSVDELKEMLKAVDKKIETLEEEKERRKMSRGNGALELMKLDDSYNDLSSKIVKDASKIDIPNEYLGMQATENFKPLKLSVVADFNPYLPLPSLTDTFLTQNNYQTDLLADYIPALTANDRSEYVVGQSTFGQFQGLNCEHQYFQTSLYTADTLKSYGMGYPVVGSYLAAQEQQQNVLTSVLQGNCFQSGDCCSTSGDCYGNFSQWQTEWNN